MLKKGATVPELSGSGGVLRQKLSILKSNCFVLYPSKVKSPHNHLEQLPAVVNSSSSRESGNYAFKAAELLDRHPLNCRKV